MGRAIRCAAAALRRCGDALASALVVSAWLLRVVALADDPSVATLEERVDEAIAAAEAALEREDGRLDDLATRRAGRPLADGRPSLSQAAANVRLLNRRIRELEAEGRELRAELKKTLAALGPDLVALARRLSSEGRETAPERDESEEEADEAAAGVLFRDCPDCPEMIVVPPGGFDMGSPATEAGRYDNEGPVRPVTIGYRFAVGVHEVTRGEFGRFVAATNRAMEDSCWMWDGAWREQAGAGWHSPGFFQDDEHPVTCVSWNDAKAYVRWLSERTGEPYRLLSESEWEYVARAGTTTPRWWEAQSPDQCRYANGADATTDYVRAANCNDGHPRTSPVGSYDANGFGLYDVLGNVFEWLDDCWNPGYRNAPLDGRAWEDGNCDRRVFRGGSWLNEPRFLRSAFRVRYAAGYRSNVLGFRVARSLDP